MGEKMYVLGGESWTVTESGTVDCSCKGLRLGADPVMGYCVLLDYFNTMDYGGRYVNTFKGKYNFYYFVLKHRLW